MRRSHSMRRSRPPRATAPRKTRAAETAVAPTMLGRRLDVHETAEFLEERDPTLEAPGAPARGRGKSPHTPLPARRLPRSRLGAEAADSAARLNQVGVD